jgi:hypothetical protein
MEPGKGPSKADLRAYRETIADCKAATDATNKHRILKSAPREFYLWLFDEHITLTAVQEATGIASTTLRIHLHRLKIPYSNSHSGEKYRRIEGHLKKLEASINWLTSDAEIPNLTRNHYLICACPHFPTASMIWIRRLIGMALAKEPDGLVVMGDFSNNDAASRYAKQHRGVMPRLMEELRVGRRALKLFDAVFDHRIYIALGNHDLRPLAMLQSEYDGDDFWQHMTGKGVWIDTRILDLQGKVRLIHIHGRKVPYSLPNELSLRYGMPVFVAGSHRHLDSYSYRGEPIGMLGCLCNIKRVQWWSGEPSFTEWKNSIWEYRDGKMYPYTEENTDWRQYEKLLKGK